jgi:tRNA nucleotidyltransferase (CCA-adding enzyme)
MEDVGELLDGLLERITPSGEENLEDGRVVEFILGKLRSYGAEPMLVGSMAKNTDLRGDKDIDVFILFPAEVGRESLEEKGLEFGKRFFRDVGGEYEIDYAEHPYVKGVYSGYDVEIVPCYKGGEMKSSVDRTPLHMEYVNRKLDENPGLASEIRLLKQFMKGVNVYGAEPKVEGFSGYLVEVSAINFGGFLGVLEAAREWSGVEVIDPEGLWDEPDSLRHFFTNASLIVVDPVDRNRNVAAALSAECLSMFKSAADEFLVSPSMDFFFPPEKPMRGRDELASALESRGTIVYAVVFRHKKINVNTLYAQLRRTLRSLRDELERSDFKVFKTGFWSNELDVSVVLLEFSVYTLPEVVHHLGPPLDVDVKHIERFKEKHVEHEPYVRDGRWVVDMRRRFTEAGQLLEFLVFSRRGFGKNLRGLKDVGIVSGTGVLSLDGGGWLEYLNVYLD